jgi:uncharacterized protein YjaG (DUF416 family)
MTWAPRFDRSTLAKRLGGLAPRQRAAFAALAAERLLPHYRSFHAVTQFGTPAPLERGIELVWQVIDGHPVTREELEAAVTACEAVTPDTEDFETPLVSRALDAASASAAALQACLDDAIRHAVDAAEAAWEAAFGCAQVALTEDLGRPRVVDLRLIEAASTADLVEREERAQDEAMKQLRGLSIDQQTARRLREDFGRP